MSNTRLDDILKSKKPGDVWYSLEAPEQVRFWNKDRPWNENQFSKVGIKVEGVTVKASRGTGIENKQTFDRKHKMSLDCGVDVIRGYINTTQSMSASFNLRVDSCRELNDAMKELSAKTGFEVWEVRTMHVYNDSAGIFTEFKVHNPNCQGDALCTWRFENSDGSKLYPEASLSFQQKAISGFYEEYTHCTMEEKTVIEKSCAKKLRKKGSQIKVRKG